ncbi:hypothetical protein Y032_0352g3283 [Ancylostoma ceylanicum]|nr:hypothetical protein Y032_0352g3283 [Ancylostoma ceylanicum]
MLCWYPCAESVITIPRVHIYTKDSLKTLAYVIAALLIMAIPIAIFIFSSAWYFLHRRDHLSQRTRRMQRRFFIFLCLQISVPAVSLAVPIACVLLIIKTVNTTFQSLGNVALAAIGLHGTITSVLVIFCNDPYRQFVMDLFIYRWRPKKHHHIAVTLSVDSHPVQRSP